MGSIYLRGFTHSTGFHRVFILYISPKAAVQPLFVGRKGRGSIHLIGFMHPIDSQDCLGLLGFTSTIAPSLLGCNTCQALWERGGVGLL